MVNGCHGGSVFFNNRTAEHLNVSCDSAAFPVSNTTERLRTEDNGNVKIVRLENEDSKTYCFGSRNVKLEVIDGKRCSVFNRGS